MGKELTSFWEKNEQHRSTLIFNLYRVSIVTIFILSDLFHWQGVKINPEFQTIFISASVVYILFTIFSVYWAYRHITFNKVAILHSLVDLAYLLLLIRSFWGTANLFPIFMNLAILGNGIVLPVYFILPYVAICLLATLGYYHYFSADYYTNFLQQIMWTASFLVTGLVVRLAVGLLKQTQRIATERGVHLFNLEQMSELIINHFDEGVLLIDSDGYVRLMNESARRTLGLSPEQDIQSIDDLPSKIKHHLQKWQSSKSCTEDESISPVFNGLRLKFYALGQEVNSSATAIFLEDTSTTIEKAQSMKLASLGRFTASIAHELRNPLGAVSHAVQLLAENEKFSENEARLINIITNQSERMNQIIKNVLQLSRRTQPSTSNFNLNTFLAEFIEKFKQGMRSHVEFKIICEVAEPAISFDASQLLQILTNLCENAINFAEKAGNEPFITFKIYENEYGHDIMLNISDNGPGFDTNHYAHLFEPFFTTDRRGGTGLGLYLCKELCEANRAIIKAEKPSKKGATFKIQFRQVAGSNELIEQDGARTTTG